MTKNVADEAYEKLLGVIKKRGFIWGPSPEIYEGGVAGFYDFGTLGKLLKNNLENAVRKVCVRNNFWEVECPLILPRIVWEASGHLERFIDPVITCKKCKMSLRADNFIKENAPDEIVDGLSFEEMDQKIASLGLECPRCKGEFGKVHGYNLMMKTQIGYDQEAYLRPETATTTYLLFKRYVTAFRDKLPFTVFQIGKAFRNEISPRQGVLRLREFTQAEAQIFTTEELANNYPDFERVKDYELPFLSAEDQEKGANEVSILSLEEALEKGVLKKQGFAFCFYISHQIFTAMGFSSGNLRFRQHKSNEKAHYAHDAWDLEVRSQKFEWVECCGIHDRGTYDLGRHASYSKENFDVGPKNAKEIPGVLEIAFGIERPLYLLLELSYREDVVKDRERTWFNFPPIIAPIQIAVFPLMKKDKLPELATRIYEELLDVGFYVTYDESGAIGRRYRRQDEIGTPYCVTVDYESLEDQTVTIRKRDDMSQERVAISEIQSWLRESIRQMVS